MNKKFFLSNENGITLIELLAVIAILSFLIVIAYNVLLSGINDSTKITDDVSLQEEMNYILTSISNMHHSQNSYSIIMDANPNATTIKLQSKDASGAILKEIDINNNNYTYTLYDYSSNTDKLLQTTTTVNTSNPLYIKIVISNIKNPNDTYETKTIISRL